MPPSSTALRTELLHHQDALVGHVDGAAGVIDVRPAVRLGAGLAVAEPLVQRPRSRVVDADEEHHPAGATGADPLLQSPDEQRAEPVRLQWRLHGQLVDRARALVPDVVDAADAERHVARTADSEVVDLARLTTAQL